MLNHLFTTILICLGVANTTPISNYDQKESNQVLTTPKKENTTTQYTLGLSNGQETSQTYTNETPVESYYLKSDKRVARRKNFTNGNYAINVLGNIYYTQVQNTLEDVDNINRTVNYIENYSYINGNLDYYYRQRTEMCYVYKITPYNYNVNTTLNIRNTIQLIEWEDVNDIEWYTYETYLIRNVYITTQENSWDNYINQTITEYQAYDICRDIENVNNGFYYTKTQTLIQVGYNTTDRIYEDIIDIEIVPQIDNFIVVEYIPLVRAVNMGMAQDNYLMIPMRGTALYWYGTQINGTNIIPDGTYEVVDIPGLMYEVIGMPFAFVSQAFNLTLFPGTPYQINIANLFLSIAAIFIFVWLILLFVKMKG